MVYGDTVTQFRLLDYIVPTKIKAERLTYDRIYQIASYSGVTGVVYTMLLV